MGFLFKLFNQHPQSVCMTYFQHFSFSLNLCLFFSKKSIQALIHAVFPSLFITSSSDTQKELSNLFEQVGCR